MTFLRYIAMPFGFLFGLVVSLRRTLFELGIFKRKKGSIPSIVVGNISVGGTGKTPMVIWLAQKLHAKNPVVLSRGYGRSSKGFVAITDKPDTAKNGDEPTEIFEALLKKVPVYLCEKRLDGLQQIRSENATAGLAILDDGFQHLQLKADLNLLLCNYHKPFFKDLPMPAGRLREFAFNARYADVIVVTKCPADMGAEDGLQWFSDLASYGKPIFFAHYAMTAATDSRGNALPKQSKVVLVSGLADNEFFAAHSASEYQVVKQFAYRDHHAFTAADLAAWKGAMATLGASALVTTRKDLYKIRELDPELAVFERHTDVEILFDSEEALIALILNKFEPTA